MNISFEGYDERAITFKNNRTAPAEAGKAAEITANGEVGLCTEGKPAGIVISADGEYAVVQTGGFVTCTYSGSEPTLGWGSVTGAEDGNAAFDGDGRPCLIVETDAVAGTVGFIL